MKWTHNVKRDLLGGKRLEIGEGQFVPILYRPFSKQWSYYSRRFNERVYQMPKIFPNAELPNRVIAVTGKGGKNEFSVLMADHLTDLHLIDVGAQCFPLWLYDMPDPNKNDLFSDIGVNNGFTRRDAISKYALDYFALAYPNETISREDIFYYIYGLLHSEEYRSRFSASLSKELPRIPCVRSVHDYRAFRDAGRKLGQLHINYESIEPYGARIDIEDKVFRGTPEMMYRVEKMRHPGSGAKKDLTTVIYNSSTSIRDIPLEAYDYIVSGKSAISWVMERQGVKTDNASGIVSDANRYAIETMDDPRYSLDLILRVITVSLETMKIVRSLPDLKLN